MIVLTPEFEYPELFLQRQVAPGVWNTDVLFWGSQIKSLSSRSSQHSVHGVL